MSLLTQLQNFTPFSVFFFRFEKKWKWKIFTCKITTHKLIYISQANKTSFIAITIKVNKKCFLSFYRFCIFKEQILSQISSIFKEVIELTIKISVVLSSTSSKLSKTFYLLFSSSVCRILNALYQIKNRIMFHLVSGSQQYNNDFRIGICPLWWGSRI